MSVRLCNIDLRDGEYIVDSYSKTSDGFWVGTGACTRLPVDTAAGRLGAAVRDALDRSEQGVPTPPRDADLARPLLEALGLKIYSEYARGTRSVEVAATDSGDGETVEVTPKANGGAKRGFTPIEEAVTSFAYDSPEQLGKEVVAALTRAK